MLKLKLMLLMYYVSSVFISMTVGNTLVNFFVVIVNFIVMTKGDVLRKKLFDFL